MQLPKSFQLFYSTNCLCLPYSGPPTLFVVKILCLTSHIYFSPIYIMPVFQLYDISLLLLNKPDLRVVCLAYLYLISIVFISFCTRWGRFSFFKSVLHEIKEGHTKELEMKGKSLGKKDHLKKHVLMLMLPFVS